MTTAIIVQARLGSSRLPAKVMLSLPNGRTVLETVLSKCLSLTPKIADIVCLAVPDSVDGDIISDHVSGSMGLGLSAVTTVRGSETDVLSRYALAANAVDADYVVRITADCPCINPSVCAGVIDLYKGGDICSYTSNVYPVRTFPVGYDCEVFSRKMLDEANKEATSEIDREHVTPWIRRNATEIRLLENNDGDHSSIRVTLDTIDDYRSICVRMKNEADQCI